MCVKEVLLIVTVSCLVIGFAESLGSASRNGSNGRSSTKSSKPENTKEIEFHQSLNGGFADSAPPKAQRVKDSSSRKSKGIFSAWAIIATIVSVILCGFLMYYATIFYPILCKKERKYDVMDVSSTP